MSLMAALPMLTWLSPFCSAKSWSNILSKELRPFTVNSWSESIRKLAINYWNLCFRYSSSMTSGFWRACYYSNFYFCCYYGFYFFFVFFCSGFSWHIVSSTLYYLALRTSPLVSKYWSILLRNGSLLTVSELPTIQTNLLALVTATFILLNSLRNPTSLARFDRTIEITMHSFSRPWNPSTVETSTFWTSYRSS
jgi:hypothetical protein